MAQNFERVVSRLENIQAIEPLLSALRTISMGTWQSALSKMDKMQRYERYYDHILAEILPHLKERNLGTAEPHRQKSSIADAIILLVGSERGLCGKFNQLLVDSALSWIEQQAFPSYQVWAMGSRLISELERHAVDIAWRKTLASGSLPTYIDTYRLAINWLSQYESFAFNKLFILFNENLKGGRYRFSAFSLLPYEIYHPVSMMGETEELWPPYIIETDPKGIYRHIIEHYIASSFYQILLKSAVAENSARFHLMEEAKDNADEIIEELQGVINTERKRRITQEMQELASGAGLLDNR